MSSKKPGSAAWPADEVERWDVGTLVPYARNSRVHSDEQVAQIAASIQQFGFTIPVLVSEDGEIIAGHGRVMAAKSLGIASVPVMIARGWSEEQRRAYVIADNRLAENATWDDDLLALELGDLRGLIAEGEFDFDLTLTGFSAAEIDDLLKVDVGGDQPPAGNLADRFGVPPFSVLNAREGWWQDRKRAWISLGIKSEEGRDIAPTSVAKNTPDYMAGRGNNAGGSIFDPVLCELAYRWFAPPGGMVLDPFAGGSVRGIVASKLGRRYVGVDLRAEQVQANRVQAKAICSFPEPVWHVGDSLDIRSIAAGTQADFLFSCPPYADLEVYSDDPRDISNMGYPEFRAAYEQIIAEAASLLKPDRFACFVVGDARGKDGCYYGLPWHTIAAFERAGLRLYNEAVLLTSVGTLPIRAGKQFDVSRKMGKAHQNVLVFVKGDPKRATEAIGIVERGDIEGVSEGEAGQVPAAPLVIRTDAPATPVVRVGDSWIKRDDLFEVAGVRGGKVRSCWRLSQGSAGLVTAGSRASPQVNIVAHIAKALGVPCRVHTPQGALSPEVQAAKDCGAEVVQHKAGHNSVIVARAREDAKARGWTDIPFGMECREAVEETAGQVASLPRQIGRIVVPVGSGMSLAGILAGIIDLDWQVPVLGIVVGASPIKRLDKWAPVGWPDLVTLRPAGIDYHAHAPVTALGGIELDPIYEAKCLPFMAPGDLLWAVGIRQTATP